MYQAISRSAVGGLAGLVATVPMTGVMAAVERGLMPTIQALAPKQIVANTVERANIGHINRRTRNVASWIAHFAFGAATGAIYPLVSSRIPLPATVKGSVYGLAVWASSYLGWLPAARILPPATKQTRRRNVSLIAAHLVWGATVGVLVNRLARDQRH